MTISIIDLTETVTQLLMWTYSNTIQVILTTLHDVDSVEISVVQEG